jgi:hypothetical protein
MKKVLRKIYVLVLVVCLMQNTGMTVLASEKNVVEIPNTTIEIEAPESDTLSVQTTASLSACTFGIVSRGDGVGLTLITRATAAASEIGVKDIVIQEKTLFGWRDINVDKQYINNSDVFSGGVVLYSAEKGKTYRAHGTHYAIINGREYTLYAESSELTYN